MKRSLTKIGVLLIVGIGVYIYAINDQIADIEEVCKLFPVGAPMGDLKKLEQKYSVKLMGPFSPDGKQGTQTAIFCATMTMCDNSCQIEFKDGQVASFRLSSM